MHGATKALLTYVTLSVSVLAYATDCGAEALDNQGDEGSARHFLSGNGSRVFKANDPFFGTYKTRSTDPVTQVNCRWRVFKADKSGHWEQTSPRKVGEWNHLSDLAHRGTVRLKEPLLFVSQKCPRWEARQ